MKIKPLLLILAGSVFLLASCYKNETVYYDQLDVTLTQYEKEFNFSSYESFWIPDSTILKTNYFTEEEIDAFYAPGGTSEKTLEIVSQKFKDRGYVPAADSASADFVTAPTILMIRHTSATYYPPGWWWGYPGYGWGYPGYGWGYPGYGWNPGYVSYQTYKEGTIIVEMIDGETFANVAEWRQEPSNEPPEMLIRWMATIDGYISSNGDYNQERAQRGIDEAFEQSPYLKK